MPEPTLADLGERRLIEEVLARRYEGSGAFGDDCAPLPPVSAGQTVVATTDPCPEPMAAILGYDDLYYRGWLLAVINLSDLAAAGAKPVGLLTSLVLPRELPVRNLERLLDGIDEAASVAGTRVVGGNIKEGPRLDLTATAFGVVDGRPLSRRGCADGDAVVVIGNLGAFWAGALAIMRGLSLGETDADDLLGAVLTPRAKTDAGMALHALDVVTASIDNSDGLGACLETLAAANGVSIVVSNVRKGIEARAHDIARRLALDPLRLVFGWGDWHLVACIALEDLDQAIAAIESVGDEVHVIGHVSSGPPIVRVVDETSTGILYAPASERFASDSWFTTGIDAYVDQILFRPLIR